MRLDYTILWVDDQPDDLTGTRRTIRARLSRLGFEPDLIERTSIQDEELRSLHKDQSIDLILMDWNLKGGADGAELAKRVRAVFKHTDIIFYSSASRQDLRKAIFDKGIDGVFCCPRQELPAEVIGVVETTMRKVMDINHMRGLVMAGVTDIDQLMDDCLVAYFEGLSVPERMELLGEIRNKLDKFANDETAQLEKFIKAKNFQAILHARSVGTTFKYLLLQDMAAGPRSESLADHVIERLGKCDEEVIGPRNKLAHGRVEKVEGKSVVRIKGTTFTSEKMTELRRSLLDHRDNFSDLLAAIRSWAPTEAIAEAVKEALVDEVLDAISDSEKAV